MKILGVVVMLPRMNTMPRWIWPVLSTLALGACVKTVVVEPPSGSLPPPSAVHARVARAPGGSYTVARGDTLDSSAFRNGVDFRDLARWNNIAPPYTIWPGQALRLSPPSGAAVAGATSTVAAAQPGNRQGLFEPVPAAAPPAAHPVPATAGTTKPVPAAAASVHTAMVASASSASAGSGAIVPVAGRPTPSQPPAPATTPVVPSMPIPSGATRDSGGVQWRWPADGAVVSRFQAGSPIPGIEIAGNQGDPVRAAADGVVVYSGDGLVGYGELVIIKHSDSLLSAYGHNSKRLVTEGQHVKAGQEIALMGASSASRDELEFQIRKNGNPVDPLDYLPKR